MTKRKLTRAEQLLRHRRIFELARERGVTLRAAEKLLVRAEWEEAQARLAAVKRCGRLIDDRAAMERAAERALLRPIPDDAPWMMRD